MKAKSTIQICSLLSACLISAAYPGNFPALAQEAAMVPQPPSAIAGRSYSDIVSLADQAQLVANVRIRNIIALKAEQAGTVPAGYKRLYIEADVLSLIRGDGGITPGVTYLYDAPLDSRGKLPKLKKAEVILFARPGTRPGEIQLIQPDAQLPASAQTTAQVKAILSSLAAPDAPPRIIGVGDAFHSAGTIAGEGETQIFLRTQNGDPVSLSILRRPGQVPRWAVALGEIVDEAARPPEPGTLLWYRLACGLPAELPARSTRSLATLDAEAARADYKLVTDAIGLCGRTQKPG